MIKTEIKQRFTDWWARKNTRPLVKLVSTKTDYDAKKLMDTSVPAKNPYDFHLSPEYRIAEMNNYLTRHDFWCDAFPFIDLNIGPGSMATYLGGEPQFSYDTIWYNEIKTDSLSGLGEIAFDPRNKWWETHKKILKRAVKLSAGKYPIAVPDIQENLDILSALRGPANLCFDLMDEPGLVKKYQAVIDGAFYRYYDECYNIVKLEDGSSVFTAFSIWGAGKTAKLQCDFSALISPQVFDEYVLPALTKQCAYLDNTLYHLDGKDAVRHLDSVLSIERLNALQWTPGAGQPDGGDEKWYPIYDKCAERGKGMWISIYDGSAEKWIYAAKRILKRYGSRGVYFLFGVTDQDGACKIIRELKL